MEENTYVAESCHSCFKDNSKTSITKVMLGMTVCFSTLWRFPYQLVTFGGGAYLVIYLILAALFVYPALTAEWGLGRLTGRGMEKAYSQVKFPGRKMIPTFLFLIVLAIGSYFVVWIGWILRYAYSSMTDSSLSQSATVSENYFNTEVASNPVSQWVFSLIVLILVAPTILGGNQRIQSISNKIVPIFYSSVLIVAAIVLLQPGVASASIGYLTNVDFATQVTAYTFIAALGQAFFSLCLGGSFMVLYGSYMSKDENHNIPLNAGVTVVGNTIASLISAFLIIGVLVLAGISSGASAFGPGLFFGVIPEAFQLIGQSIGAVPASILMAIFFVMFFFAAYLPMTAIVEVTTVFLVDKLGIDRKRAFVIIASLTMLLSIPSILSPLDGGFLYNMDLFVGAMGLIIGSFFAIIAFMWYVPKDIVLKEVNSNSKFKLGNKWYFWTKYVTPGFMLLVILYVLSDVVISATTKLNGLTDADYVLYDGVVKIFPFAVLILIAFAGFLYKIDRNKTDKTVKSVQ